MDTTIELPFDTARADAMIEKFLASVGGQYSFDGRRADDTFSKTALDLVVKHHSASDDLRNYGRLLVQYIEQALGQGEDIPRTTSRVTFEKEVFLMQISGLKLIAQSADLPAEDRLKAGEEAERLRVRREH